VLSEVESPVPDVPGSDEAAGGVDPTGQAYASKAGRRRARFQARPGHSDLIAVNEGTCTVPVVSTLGRAARTPFVA